MIQQQQEVLRNLGYDMSNPNKSLMMDALWETMDLMDHYEIQDVEALVRNPQSHIYVELAYFIDERGMVVLHQSLNNFQSSINQNNVNPDVKRDVYGERQDINVYDSIYLISKYIKENITKKEHQHKVIEKI